MKTGTLWWKWDMILDVLPLTTRLSCGLTCWKCYSWMKRYMSSNYEVFQIAPTKCETFGMLKIKQGFLIEKKMPCGSDWLKYFWPYNTKPHLCGLETRRNISHTVTISKNSITDVEDWIILFPFKKSCLICVNRPWPRTGNIGLPTTWDVVFHRKTTENPRCCYPPLTSTMCT